MPLIPHPERRGTGFLSSRPAWSTEWAPGHVGIQRGTQSGKPQKKEERKKERKNERKKGRKEGRKEERKKERKMERRKERKKERKERVLLFIFLNFVCVCSSAFLKFL